MVQTSRIIRLAKENDISYIMPIFDEARAKMHASGNSRQWINGYPSVEKVLEDIRQNGAFVVEEKESIVAYFAFLPSPQPTYGKIVGGKWLEYHSSYHVIHRIAAMHRVTQHFAIVLTTKRQTTFDDCRFVFYKMLVCSLRQN